MIPGEDQHHRGYHHHRDVTKSQPFCRLFTFFAAFTDWYVYSASVPGGGKAWGYFTLFFNEDCVEAPGASE